MSDEHQPDMALDVGSTNIPITSSLESNAEMQKSIIIQGKRFRLMKHSAILQISPNHVQEMQNSTAIQAGDSELPRQTQHEAQFQSTSSTPTPNKETLEFFDVQDSVHMVEISTESVANVPNIKTDMEGLLADLISSEDEQMSGVEEQQLMNGELEHVLNNTNNAKSNAFDEVTLRPIFDRNGDAFRCLMCPIPSDSEFNKHTISNHMYKAHKKRVYICNMCGASFQSKPALTQHFAEHERQNNCELQIECSVCNQIFYDLRVYRVHNKTHLNKYKCYTCEFCYKKYSSKKLLEEHTNTHTGKRPFHCLACLKNFASKYTLNAHMKTHLDGKQPFVCTTCGADFQKKTDLNRHYADHARQNNAEVNIECTICKQVFNSLRLYRNHQSMHTDSLKNYACEICNKKFLSRNLLEEHMNMHTGERPYKCLDCFKKFASKYSITAHIKTHLNQPRPPFTCKVCDKTCNTQYNLQRHEQTHARTDVNVNKKAKANNKLHSN